MDKLKLKASGADADIKVLKQGFNVDPLLQKQAACISTMTYNEYWQLIDAGMRPEQLVVFKYEDQGVATLEDGIYTLDAKLKDPATVDKLTRFLRASMKGWDYAIKNQPEAVKIVLKNDTTGAQTEKHQTRMMGEIAKLVADQPKGIGYLEEADYNRTVDVLLKGSSDPVITKKPVGAWTHDVWDKAMKK
jgi:NitT/TauT family transport system substrate-binding protein